VLLCHGFRGPKIRAARLATTSLLVRGILLAVQPVVFGDRPPFHCPAHFGTGEEIKHRFSCTRCGTTGIVAE
jgi:hypothetical protein